MGLSRNVELKARDRSPERSPATCETLGAAADGVLIQCDTYFHVPNGRLKLREEEGAVAHLIAYERPDLNGQRESRYRIVPVADAEGLKAALASALGVEVVVEKERHLWLWKEVRVHLDRVDGLGDFVEFEAVLPEGGSDLAAAEARVETLRQAFGIEDADLVGGSYCDLALAAGRA